MTHSAFLAGLKEQSAGRTIAAELNNFIRSFNNANPEEMRTLAGQQPPSDYSTTQRTAQPPGGAASDASSSSSPPSSSFGVRPDSSTLGASGDGGSGTLRQSPAKPQPLQSFLSSFVGPGFLASLQQPSCSSSASPHKDGTGSSPGKMVWSAKAYVLQELRKRPTDLIVSNGAQAPPAVSGDTASRTRDPRATRACCAGTCVASQRPRHAQ